MDSQVDRVYYRSTNKKLTGNPFYGFSSVAGRPGYLADRHIPQRDLGARLLVIPNYVVYLVDLVYGQSTGYIDFMQISLTGLLLVIWSRQCP